MWGGGRICQSMEGRAPRLSESFKGAQILPIKNRNRKCFLNSPLPKPIS